MSSKLEKETVQKLLRVGALSHGASSSGYFLWWFSSWEHLVDNRLTQACNFLLTLGDKY